MSQTKVSIVVPAYKEKENLKPLCERIFAALTQAGYEQKNLELIIVDDNSNDGSVEVVNQLSSKYPIRIEVRLHDRGLSSAVVHGFEKAKNDILVVMDADLQHDPKYLPSIISPIATRTADFVVGSRNVDGGMVEDWPLIRRLISAGATLLARPLTPCSDPMSGFFALRRDTYKKHASRLNPMGYKIGLELMVRCRCKKIKDVPIVFRDREAGESKLTMKQNLLYLKHLANLYVDRFPALILLGLVILLLLAYYVLF